MNKKSPLSSKKAWAGPGLGPKEETSFFSSSDIMNLLERPIPLTPPDN